MRNKIEELKYNEIYNDGRNAGVFTWKKEKERQEFNIVYIDIDARMK